MGMSITNATGARVLTAIGLAGLLSCGGLTVVAAPSAPTVVAQAAREISRDQAVALVQQRFNARVLRVNVVDEGGHRVYVLQILSEGTKVSFVRVDAATGTVSRD
jgi:hypothetical protein